MNSPAAVNGVTDQLELPPTPESAGRCRRYLTELLTSWQMEPLLDAVELCASELVANAVLHARTPVGVWVLKLSNGVRVEVRDTSPAVPLPVPRGGTAGDVMEYALTGRGLHVVAALASAWGIDSHGAGKTVWFEVWLDESAESASSPSQQPMSLRLRSLPVRAAVGSGRHVDDLVREIQLGGATPEADLAAAAQELRAALDRSAPARLAGRAAALAAAAAHRTRFDLDLEVTADALTGVGELNALLDRVSEAVQQRGLAAVTPEPAVREFRSWLTQEVARQLAGEPPTPCPLPD